MEDEEELAKGCSQLSRCGGGMVYIECFCGQYATHTNSTSVATTLIRKHWVAHGGLKQHLVDHAYGRKEDRHG